VQNKKGLTPKICTSTTQGTTKVQIFHKQQLLTQNKPIFVSIKKALYYTALCGFLLV